jgi:glycosyltransferase involved in cell wall biosynthesis
MVIVESLSQGLPVLTNVNTPWNNIKTYNAGWFIKDSYLELKKNLNIIFNTSKSQFYIKSRNAIYLANKFNWKYISKEYIHMYMNLLK